MLVTTENPSLELKVAGSTMSANGVISEALVTMWAKNGTAASALSQRDGSVQEKLKLLQELSSTLTAPGSPSMPLAMLLVTTPLPGRAFIIAGMSLAPRPSIFFCLPADFARSSRGAARFHPPARPHPHRDLRGRLAHRTGDTNRLGRRNQRLLRRPGRRAVLELEVPPL